MNEKTLSYETVEQTLTQANAETDAAEAHGILCGLFAVAGDVNADDWIAQIVGERDPAQVLHRDANKLLKTLHEITLEQMTSGDFNFHLLLPDDETLLDDRVDELSVWCQGFLVGMSTAGVRDLQTLPGEVGEIVKDILDISQAGYDAGGEDDAEENEAAYAEIVEYLRVGVLLVHAEFNNKNGKDGQPTLH